MSKIEVFDIKKKKNVTLKKPMAEAMFKMGFVDFLDDDGNRITNPKARRRQTYSTRMLQADDVSRAGEDKPPIKETTPERKPPALERLGITRPPAKAAPAATQRKPSTSTASKAADKKPASPSKQTGE